MTTNRIVPKGLDALDDLTIGELGSISRALKADVLRAFRGAGEEGIQRFESWARVAHVWAKRTDPGADLATFRNMTAGELSDALGMTDDDDDQGNAEPDPTPPGASE